MAITDKLNKMGNGTQPLPTQLSAQKLTGAGSASINAATGWDTTTAKHIRMYQTKIVNTQTIPDQATLSYYKCTISGTTLSNLQLIWSATGSDPTYAAGTTVDIGVTSGWIDDLIAGLLVSLNQDGTLKTGAVSSASMIAAGIISDTHISTGFGLVTSGAITQYAGRTAPSGWLLCDGSAVSRSTYATLFNIVSPTIGTFTTTIATPGVMTLNAHGFLTGAQVYLTTTGALPTGLTANTLYYIIKIDANTFNLATSLANAIAGTKIATTGTQSGVHTLVFCPYGLGNGSTTFNVPSLSGKVAVGINTADTDFDTLGKSGGSKDLKAHNHGVTDPGHIHSYYQGRGSVSYAGGANNAIDSSLGLTGTNVGSNTTGLTVNTAGTGSNNMQPFISLNYIVKT